jgi:hypothetical protein
MSRPALPRYGPQEARRGSVTSGSSKGLAAPCRAA